MLLRKKFFSISLPEGIDIRTKKKYPFTDFNYAVGIIIENALRENLLSYNGQVITDTYKDSGSGTTVFMTKSGEYFKIQKINENEAKQKISRYIRSDMGLDHAYELLKNISELIGKAGINIRDDILTGDCFTFEIPKNKMNFNMICIVSITDQRKYLKVKFQVDNETNYRSGGRAGKRREVTKAIYDLYKQDIDKIGFKIKYCDTYTGFLKEFYMEGLPGSISNLPTDILEMTDIISQVI